MRSLNILACSLVFLISNSTFAMGEYLSKKDNRFLKRLSSEEEVNAKLGTSISFLINGHRIPVNKGTIGNSSEYFRELMTNGMSESQGKDISLKDIHEDIFLKIVRMIYEKKYDPFDSNSDSYFELTSELLRKLDFFRLKKLKSLVLKTIHVNDDYCFRSVFKIADELEQYVDGKEDLLKACAFHIRNGNPDPTVDQLIDLIGEEYFQEKVPAFFTLYKGIQKKRNSDITEEISKQLLEVLNADNASGLEKIIKEYNLDIFRVLLPFERHEEEGIILSRDFPKDGSRGSELLAVAIDLRSENCVRLLVSMGAYKPQYVIFYQELRHESYIQLAIFRGSSIFEIIKKAHNDFCNRSKKTR